MKSRWKARSTREFIRILYANGFDYVGCRGSHKKFQRDGKIVIINNNLNKMICQRLIKENNLEVQ